MSVTTNEKYSLLGDLGVGKVAYSATYPVISQTISFEVGSDSNTPSSGVMLLLATYLPIATTITYITFVSVGTAESSGTHLWYALYDDGRGSTTSGQLALLRHTADQTGATAFVANSALSLALISPYVTKYSGIYYVAFMCAASTVPTLFSTSTQTPTVPSIPIVSSGATCACTAGSSLTYPPPNPSGSLSNSGILYYAYVS
jgi:hypothetical protein